MIINFDVPMPPSVNKAYFNNPNSGRGRVLSTEARQFKREVTATATGMALAAGWIPDRKSEYGLILLLECRKKNRDLSNIIKLTEDAVFDGLGVNDSFNMLVMAYKIVSTTDACHVWVGDKADITSYILEKFLGQAILRS